MEYGVVVCAMFNTTAQRTSCHANGEGYKGTKMLLSATTGLVKTSLPEKIKIKYYDSL